MKILIYPYFSFNALMVLLVVKLFTSPPNWIISLTNLEEIIWFSISDIYKIVSTANILNADKDIYMRYINSSGSIVSASNYDSANMHMKADTTKDEDKFQNGAYSYSGAIIGNYENGGGVHWIYNPFSSSSYTFMTFEGAGGYDSSSNKTRSQKGIGILKQAASMTGINFYSSNASNTFTATINVYGLRVD